MKDAARHSCRRFSGVINRPARRRRMSGLVPLAMVAALALAGCSSGGMKSAMQGNTPAMKPAAAPKPKGPTPMDTFRAMAQPAGIKLTPLFLDQPPDDEARFKRVESAVQELRDDFDTVAPTLVRLAAVEKDMKDLVGQLKALSGEAPPRQPPAAALAPPLSPAYAPPPAQPVQTAPPPAEAKAPPPVASPKPAAAPATAKTATVSAIRVGEHPGKTRIVLDLDNKTSFKSVLQEDGRKLAVTMDGIRWSARPTWSADSGNLVAGYKYEEGGLLTLDLISPAKILSQDLIEGENRKGYRIVIDLAGKNVF